MYKDIYNCYLIDFFMSKFIIIIYIKYVFICVGFFLYDMVWCSEVWK